MEKRLQQFLELEGLTPAKFSEIMGIQRSGISHLLAGRNKPSYDFIVKMISNFPNVNYEWLLLGKGKPYKDNSAIGSQSKSANDFTPEGEPQIFKPEDFTSGNDLPELDENPILEPETDDLPPFFEDKEHFLPNPKEEEAKVTGGDNPEASAKIQQTSAVSSTSSRTTGRRVITRITVFYSDGTFEER